MLRVGDFDVQRLVGVIAERAVMDAHDLVPHRPFAIRQTAVVQNNDALARFTEMLQRCTRFARVPWLAVVAGCLCWHAVKEDDVITVSHILGRRVKVVQMLDIGVHPFQGTKELVKVDDIEGMAARDHGGCGLALLRGGVSHGDLLLIRSASRFIRLSVSGFRSTGSGGCRANAHCSTGRLRC